MHHKEPRWRSVKYRIADADFICCSCTKMKVWKACMAENQYEGQASIAWMLAYCFSCMHVKRTEDQDQRMIWARWHGGASCVTMKSGKVFASPSHAYRFCSVFWKHFQHISWYAILPCLISSQLILCCLWALVWHMLSHSSPRTPKTADCPGLKIDQLF